MQKNFIIPLFRYFSRFVPLSVLSETFIQPARSQLPGYPMIQADVLADPSPSRILAIEKFVFSINLNFVSERIKNSRGFILFVEYGQMAVDFTKPNGIEQQIAVYVVHNFSDTNNDNVNETILMDQALDILMQILSQMQLDQGEIDFCADMELLRQPVEIQVVDPVIFFGCGGWCATFTNSQTLFL